MRQIIILGLLAFTVASCGNAGDKNQSEIKVRETDSTLNDSSLYDPQGSKGRNDTAVNPGNGAGLKADSASSSASGGKDSGSVSGSAKQTKSGDSTKAGKANRKPKDTAR